MSFPRDPLGSGTVRLVDLAEAGKLLPPLYESLRLNTPGFLTRNETSWKKVICTILLTGATGEHRNAGSCMRKVGRRSVLPATDNTRNGTRDCLWVRILDVPAALTSRRYQVEGRVVLELTDPFRGSAAGVFALEGGPTEQPAKP